MKKYLIIICFIIIFIFIFSCGIPLPYSSLKSVEISGNDLNISFTFICQNSESYFKGYDIYYKIEDSIVLKKCIVEYGNPEVKYTDQHPSIIINNNEIFFASQRTIKVYLNPDEATNLTVDTDTNNPLEVVVYDEEGNSFFSGIYIDKKITFIVRPYGEDTNENPIPYNDTSSNKIVIQF